MGNYEKGLYAQIEETIEENDKLKVKKLQEENTGLKAKVTKLETRLYDVETSLEEIVAKAVNVAVAAAVMPLCTEIERKDIEIKRLKSIIDKDSSNSGKPPSSDGFKKIPNNRERSENKRGGQSGHKGNTLVVPKNLEELVREEKAEHTIVDLTNGSAEYISKWAIDIKTKVKKLRRKRRSINDEGLQGTAAKRRGIKPGESNIHRVPLSDNR